jgi:uncharacterized protein (TIGR00297 family)
MALLGAHQILLAFLITDAFAFLAWKIRGVSISGAIAGGFICFILILGNGIAAFAGLVTVFVLAWASTRVGYRKKLQLGTAEKKTGRKASQVFANLSVAAGCALLHLVRPKFLFHGNEMFSLGMVTAFSEAAADTVSSELGQLQNHARLITTCQKVPAGTDGGVSPSGTLAGISAAILVSVVCFVLQLVSVHGAVLAAAAAMIGMLADSLLGALFERRRLLNNDAVNFLGTLSATSLAIIYASFYK